MGIGNILGIGSGSAELVQITSMGQTKAGEYGGDSPTWRVLYALKEFSRPCTAKEVSVSVGMSPERVKSIFKELVAMGLAQYVTR